MKKFLVFVFGLLAALAICGCQVREEGELVPEGKVFTATMEAFDDDASGVESKTSLDAGGSVLWKMGDQVSIFAGSTINEHYQVTDASDGRTAAALNRVESPGFVAGGDIDNNVAFYPYAETAELAKNGSAYVIRDIDLPATQTYAQASFGNGAFPMTAVTSSTRDYNLKFKNVLGGLKLQLKGNATIAAISIIGNNNETLCGALEVTVSESTTPSIRLTATEAKAVTLDCGDGVQLDSNTATAFIIALPPMTMAGGFTVTVTDCQGKQMEIKTARSQTITRSNLLAMPAVTYEGIGPDPESESVAVDLGLPSGLKWASCNLGATAPEEYGDYYAWGETEPYYSSQSLSTWKDGKTAGYVWASYSLCNGSYSTLTKYNYSSFFGTVDYKTSLDPEDDAAYVKRGGSWRMPTSREWEELIDNCTWTWTTHNGVEGYLVTGPNSSSIFLPCAGSRRSTNFYTTYSYGEYWSSSLSTDHHECACGVNFSSNGVSGGTTSRCLGLSLRPVSDEEVRVPVENVIISEGNLTLTKGVVVSILAEVKPNNATQPSIIWSSSSSDIVSVDADGYVTTVSEGTATITATTCEGGFTATCTVTVKAPSSSVFPEAIDLGLPSGLKWANCNLGATEPEQFGDYYAWGETEPYYVEGHSLEKFCQSWKAGKTGYNWASYKDSFTYNKYHTTDFYDTVDNKTVLDFEDDAAHVNWGDYWRMPTTGEWDELIDNCTWTWTTQNSVKGYLVTGPNGNSIFLPAAGFQDDFFEHYSYLSSVGDSGYYWSSSLYSENDSFACYALFYPNVVKTIDSQRSRGIPVRPVEGVFVPAEKVTINESSITLIKGETITLSATVTPSNATQPYVIWSSSDTDVASLEYYGKVTALAEGTATITATSGDGGRVATCTVVVVNHAPFYKEHYQGDNLRHTYGVCNVTQISELPDEKWIPSGVTTDDLVGLKIEGDIFYGGDTFLIWINIQDLTLIIPDQVICPNFKYSSYGTYDGEIIDGEGKVNTMNETITFSIHSVWGPYSFGGDEITIYFPPGGGNEGTTEEAWN